MVDAFESDVAFGEDAYAVRNDEKNEVNKNLVEAFCSGANGIGLFASVALIVLLCSGSSFSQGKPALPTGDDAKLMLMNAAKLVNFTEPSASPYHIRMKTKSYGERNKAINGTYELWFVSTSSWREDISWEDARLSRLVNADRQWVAGDDTHRVDTDRLREITTLSGFLDSISTKQIVRTKAKDIAGGPGVCIDLKQPPPRYVMSHEVMGYAGQGVGFTVNITFPDITVCLNVATGLADEIDSDGYRWEFASYAPLGEKRFPRELRKEKGKNVLVVAEVEVLEALDASRSDVLSPSANATPQLWCPNASPPEPIRFGGDTNPNHMTILPSGNSIMLPNGMGHLGFLYFDVNETGHVTDVRAFSLGRENPIKNSEKKTLLETSFRPATCRGKYISAAYTLQLPEDRQAWP